MKYGILGSGQVARTIALKLMDLGHKVMLGSRLSKNEELLKWAADNGCDTRVGTFDDAAAFGEIIFLCVAGVHAIDALKMVNPANLKGKILIDQTNPYIYSDGHISLSPVYNAGNRSLGAKVQKFLPDTNVVKTLNYLAAHLMVNPASLQEKPTGFYCGNNPDAKESVKRLLEDFGWTDTFDMGDISMSRYTEMLGAFWPSVYNSLHSFNWGFKLVR